MEKRGSPIKWAAPGLEDSHPHLNEFFDFLPILNDESDRGMTLIATSFLDELLGRILESFFVEGEDASRLMKGFNAPLSSFSSRISACVALGLINAREGAELNTLRKIRNQFAHQINVSFSDNSICDLCGNLTYAVDANGNSEIGSRALFSTSSVSLLLNLVNRPAYVALERCTARKWKM